MAQTSANTEVEVRFRVADAGAIERALTARSGAPAAVAQIIDHWLVPSDVADYASHEEWLARGCTSPLRVREVTLAGQTTTTLEAKRPAARAGYTTNHEARLPLTATQDGIQFAEALGYRRIATLTKERTEWRLAGALAHVDTYAEYGVILELEALQNGDLARERGALVRLGEELGASPSDELSVSSALTIIRLALCHTEAGTL